MSARAQRSAVVPLALGFGTLRGRRSLLVEILIRAGVVNRFIVPMPSQIAGALPAHHRRGGHRRTASWSTAQEALWATLLLAAVGVAHRRAALPLQAPARRDRDLGRRDGRGADRADVSAVPGRSSGAATTTIVMMGFVAGLPAVILKTIEGLAGTRRVLIDVGRSFKLTAAAAVLEDPASGRAADDLRRPAARPDLRADQHRRRRVPDQFRRARPAHQRSRRALRSARHLCARSASSSWSASCSSSSPSGSSDG